MRFAARLSKRGPANALALVQSEAAAPWREALILALEALQTARHPKFQNLGPPRQDPARWERFWAQWPL
eukprot:11159098-Lingulodinium_polyedra.AAC.1